MRILVDADGCPVRKIIVQVARANKIPVVMFADTSHRIEDGYSEVITASKGKDSVDIVLINRVEAGDIVVTQDYGVATMALARERDVARMMKGAQPRSRSNSDQVNTPTFGVKSNTRAIRAGTVGGKW